MSAALFQRRDAVRAIAKEYQDLLRARWLANNASRKTKRKVERQAERRQVRRQLERQNEEPSEDYVCSGGFSDDEDYFRPPDNPPVPSDGPIACSDYELKRLQTLVAISSCSNPNPEPTLALALTLSPRLPTLVFLRTSLRVPCRKRRRTVARGNVMKTRPLKRRTC